MGDLILRQTHWRLDGKPFCETWLSWNGKREKSESCKHCKQGKSSESSKNCLSRGASTTRSSNARAARAARASTQQACMIAGARVPRGAATQERQEQPEHQHSKRVISPGARAPRGAATQERPEHQQSQRVFSCASLMPLLARCAGSPGGWSWERFGRVP